MAKRKRPLETSLSAPAAVRITRRRVSRRTGPASASAFSRYRFRQHAAHTDGAVPPFEVSPLLGPTPAVVLPKAGAGVVSPVFHVAHQREHSGLRVRRAS